MKNILAFLIAEVNIKEPYLSSKLGIGYAAVGMGVLPRPKTRSAFGLGELAVLVLCGVDKGNVALVRFRLFVKQVKNSFRAGKSHYNRIELLRKLINGHYKVL